MNKKIIINSTLNEVRVAITENEKLAEFYIELPDKERFIGNIYLGKVNRIVQGINAAFIDVGLKHDAFLHFSDVDESLEKTLFLDEDDDDEDLSEQAAIALRKSYPKQKKKTRNGPTFNTKRSGKVQINLQPKQDVIVQVVREAYGHKGVKVTSKIAMPGRYLVLLPFDKLMGVSRKINSYNERRRLRKIARKFIPDGYGCIIRTVAVNRNEKELVADWKSLMETWEEIEKKVQKSKSPSLLYQDMQLAASVIRDLFSSQIERVVIDSKKLHKEIVNYLKKASPSLVNKVHHYSGNKPIFETFGIEGELAKTYKRKLPLPSGGSIVIDQTEAMIVIDVNSGRATEQEQEKNALKTNLEAMSEITRQIRLRDYGGMIIIDYIDMMRESNRKKLYNEMKKDLQRDRAKTVIYPLTQIGLMQMTRQRINQNISEKTSEICPMCNGTGRVTSKIVQLNSIERWLKNFRHRSKEFRLILQVHPHMADYLTTGTISRISRLMIKYFVKIKIQQNPHMMIDDFRFISSRKQKDITSEYL